MKISIIPAEPGTYAVLRGKKTSPSSVTYDYNEPVIAWEIVTDPEAEGLEDTTVSPIGLKGKIYGALRIVHGGR